MEILLGGAIVSLFALLGDVLQPKRFAGLFSVGAVVETVVTELTNFDYYEEKSLAA